MLYDHLPAALRDEIYEWLRENAKDERKATDSDEQFFYKTRKKALGPFKRQLWDLPADVKADASRRRTTRSSVPVRRSSAIGDTAGASSRSYVKPPVQHRPMPADATPVHAAAPDDADLTD